MVPLSLLRKLRGSAATPVLEVARLDQKDRGPGARFAIGAECFLRCARASCCEVRLRATRETLLV